jgi:glycosyltransferase involved in cell wall biosynthesis
MRVAVYTDYTYQRRDGRVFADRAFAVFLTKLRPRVEALTLVGRLHPGSDQARYPVGENVDLLELPYYERLSRPFAVLPALVRSLRIFWRALPTVDVVWLLGPHPLAVAFAVLALLRRRRVVLGVRQDTPSYVGSRHPGRKGLRAAAAVLEGSFRLLSRFLPVVVVGPELASKYRRSRRLLELTVALVSEKDVVSPERAIDERSYSGRLDVLVIGRLESEKNPLLLADVLALLNADDDRWRMLICGEGSMQPELEERLVALLPTDPSQPPCYVPFGSPLLGLYRSAHMLLHVSWTEGLPQVLAEALASALPVVATDVGGIRAAMEESVCLIPPGNARAAAEQLRRLAGDEHLRARLISRGHAYARVHTSEAEVDRLAAFLVAGNLPG